MTIIYSNNLLCVSALYVTSSGRHRYR